MTVRLVRAPAVDPGPPHDETPPARWVCAFVNNMPDGAFDATERQFLDLLDAGSGGEVVEVRRYTMPGVPRGERTAARIAEEYLPFETVREGPPDLLIVTGSNPLAPRSRTSRTGRTWPPCCPGAASTSPPCCSPACRPTPPWPCSTASSGRRSTPSAPASSPNGRSLIRWPTASGRPSCSRTRRLNTVELDEVRGRRATRWSSSPTPSDGA